MRIAILTETFSRKMGYLQNTLPKYLSRLGCDVHVISMDLPPYYQLQDFNNIYKSFNPAGELQPGTVESIDGFQLHVLPHRRQFGYMRMVGLKDKLEDLRPQIVQTIAAIGWLPMDAAVARVKLGFKLFTGSHTTVSVFPLAREAHPYATAKGLRSFLLRGITGFATSVVTEKCYAATVDCAEVANRFFGVPQSKTDICPLGVDTDLFRPSEDPSERREMRAKLGFNDDEIVCIYTGRFTEGKNPLVLAQAVEQLIAMGKPYRALFLGEGPQGESIRGIAGCTVHPFVPIRELASYFRSVDVGVWPREESLSMLDAAACGLPIIVNDTLAATERIDGNGLTYRKDDVSHLAEVLLSLSSPAKRKSLGNKGAAKMQSEFSWDAIARKRLKDYELSLNGHSR